ncbi:MAG: D-aminoacylase [Acidobacteria bacterium]|nr:D-aminoacylase [Acidobacteriota bacterium]MBI3423337.1 D-aminoacylase [Acidobacteriota bacterium]
MKKVIACWLVLACLTIPSAPQNNSATSLLLAGGIVIDGTGAHGRQADVRIIGDQISAIGKLKPHAGERVIDARGLIVAPGFVDVHNHSERGLLTDSTARSQILQGITTLAIGPDGGSPFPLADYLSKLEQQRTSVNVLAFVGHATVRQQVMGQDYKRAATEREVARMVELVEQAMREGAVGLSTGLEYDIGYPSTTEEVIELARVAAKYGGIYMSHVRDEADDAMNAFNEALRIGREGGLPVQISHIKLGTMGVWGKAREVVALIEAARRTGLDVTADCYPYDAWASTITVLVPSRKHDDPVMVKKGLNDVGGGANVLVTNCATHRAYEGKTLDEIARANNQTAVEVYMQIVKDGGASVVCKSMTEPDIRTFYQQPWVMVASDGGIANRHPRGAGTFPRVLGRYVREWKWLKLEEAIRKMSAYPAWRLGLQDRGLLKVGMKADVVAFDANKVLDQATMTQPLAEPVGIQFVIVNGVPVVEQGQVTNARPGAVLRHSTTPRQQAK